LLLTVLYVLYVCWGVAARAVRRLRPDSESSSGNLLNISESSSGFNKKSAKSFLRFENLDNFP